MKVGKLDMQIFQEGRSKEIGKNGK